MTHLNGNKIVKGKKACNLWAHAPGMPGAHCSDPEQKKLQRPKQDYKNNFFSPPPPFKRFYLVSEEKTEQNWTVVVYTMSINLTQSFHRPVLRIRNSLFWLKTVQ